MSVEKSSLDAVEGSVKMQTWRSRIAVGGLLLAIYVAAHAVGKSIIREGHVSATALRPAQCPVQPPSRNIGDDWNPLHDSAYGELAARRLSIAVQHATETFDGMPMDPTDPLFDKFYDFNEWLYSEYPKVFNGMKHELINTHAHLLTWQGSDTSLAPILLMAHTDVVPVLKETEPLWAFPPFEGRVVKDGTPDTPGTWIWGRGASDCKNSLMGIYGALERLITQGWEPERTIIVANGFDEEVGGPRGAASLARTLEERYDNIPFLVDEGFTGITFEYGKTVASLGMAEKGSMDLGIKVETPGGHSSVPPAHTGIGIMSDLLYHLEKNPFTPTLTPEAPYLKYLTCLSEHAPSFPSKMKKRVLDPRKWPDLAQELAQDRALNAFLSTTQAIDIVKGGLKRNALPEVVETNINYRIAFTSSVKETQEHIQEIITPIIKSLNMTFSIFGKASAQKSDRHVTVTMLEGVGNGRGDGLEPAPLTPDNGKSWELMAGTSKHVFGEDTIVTPTGMYANTDSKWFWNLTNNLYRFTPAVVAENRNQHTVNERISLDGHLNTTRFFYKLLLNSNGWDSE